MGTTILLGAIGAFGLQYWWGILNYLATLDYCGAHS